MKLFYQPHLKKFARELRNHSTLAEILLWKHLKGKQRQGYDFHRQCPVDRFILDFFAPQLLLAVEIDGDTHRLKARGDIERQRRLEALGIFFLRFGDEEVRRDALGVAQTIDRWIEARGFGTHPVAARHPSDRGEPENSLRY